MTDQINAEQANRAFRMGMTQMKVISRSYKKEGLHPVNAHQGHMRSSMFCLGAAILEETGNVELAMQNLARCLAAEMPALKLLLDAAHEQDQKG